MKKKTYLNLGLTLVVSACAVLMFYDTFFQSRVLLDFFDRLMQACSRRSSTGWRSRTCSPPSSTFSTGYIEKAAAEGQSLCSSGG